jgi:hypothetical protein
MSTFICEHRDESEASFCIVDTLIVMSKSTEINAYWVKCMFLGDRVTRHLSIELITNCLDLSTEYCLLMFYCVISQQIAASCVCYTDVEVNISSASDDYSIFA